MSKRCCAPYDPALRQTEHGSRLYSTWKRIRQKPHCEVWDDFPTFLNWAMQSYSIGAKLRLIDESGIYCPDNVKWCAPSEGDEDLDPQEFTNRWNITVNRIRKHYGMPPLRGTEYDF